MDLLKNKRMIITVTISLFCGLFAGYLLFHDSSAGGGKPGITIQDEQTTIWTCSMHPQVRQEEPGLCPICAMELVPLNKLEPGSDQQSPYAIQMSQSAVQLASIQTIPVRKGIPRKTLELFGKIKTS